MSPSNGCLNLVSLRFRYISSRLMVSLSELVDTSKSRDGNEWVEGVLTIPIQFDLNRKNI